MGDVNNRKRIWKILTISGLMISILAGCEFDASKQEDLSKSEVESINKSNEKYKAIQIDMSEKQVVDILGVPDEIQNNQEHIISDIKKQNKMASILEMKYGEADGYDKKAEELEDRLKNEGPFKVYIYHTKDGEGTYLTFQNGEIIDIDISDSFSDE